MIKATKAQNFRCSPVAVFPSLEGGGVGNAPSLILCKGYSASGPTPNPSKEGSREGKVAMCPKRVILEWWFDLPLTYVKAIAFLFLSTFYTQISFAQTDTLKEVDIKGEKKATITNDDKLKYFAPGQKVVTIDSISMELFRQQSMAQLLYQQAPVFIKSYGFNGLATLNFRGSSSAQSQVMWNGVPLQNASLGLADVSLLPVSMIDRVNVVYGSSSALWGSGNVGGVLQLENTLPARSDEKKIDGLISIGAGSFRQSQSGGKINYHGNKWSLGANVFVQSSLNDFSYQDENGKEQVQTNSKIEGGGVMLQAAYQPDSFNTFRFYSWLQQYERQIPPAFFEDTSAKQQKDAAARFLFNWERKKKGTVWYNRTAYIKDWMRYDDPLSLQHSDNSSSQVFEELGMRRSFWKNAHLIVFIPVHLSWFRIPDSTVQTQTRIALAASVQKSFFNNKVSVAINLREEAINDKMVFTPGISASWAIFYWLDAKISIQRTYRAPSLNELYYQPGGNTQLRPEQGWAQEFTYTAHFKKGDKFRFVRDLTFFNRDIDDWIIWFGGAIWTPHNIARVNSKGAEINYRTVFQAGKWQFHANANASYIAATTRSSYIQNDGSIGKQIPYTPLWQWQLNLGTAIRSFYFNYNHTYTGYRFVTVDESQFLPAFSTGNLQLMYTRKNRIFPLQVSLQVNNIWDARYQVVNARPMPGRNSALGISMPF